MSNKILVIPKPKINKKIRLFCFPFAGGNINTYTSWLNQFNDDVELVFIQPPGRGSRISEPPHQSMEPLIKELMQHRNFITETPYVFFGHSLGSRVAYELCCQLKLAGMQLPAYFVASGSKAPYISTNKRCLHNLPKDTFIKELEQLNGTPKEILSNKELLDFLMPLLRADFKIAETYLAKEIKMPFPIIVFYGEEDIEIKMNHLAAWHALSSVECSLMQFPGDHFFIEQSKNKILVQLVSLMNKLLNLYYPR